ncbi:MAG: hypothetical protein V3T22_14410 [Planctomycetota bacterium]
MAVHQRLGQTILVATLVVVVRTMGATPEFKERARPLSLPDLVVQRLYAENDVQRQQAMCMLSGYAPILEFLPIENLDSVEVHQETLEFRFDFDGRRTRRVRLPSGWRYVLDPKDHADPLLEGEPQWVEYEGRKLIVHRQVRFFYDENGITAVKEGDLEIKAGWFAPNLRLRTELHRGRIARDSKGRILIETDERGRPLKLAGRFVPVRADRWLVLQVKQHRIELPLDRKPVRKRAKKPERSSD